MVLAQDQAQASQAANIIAEKKYQEDLKNYNEEKAKYEEELKKYNAEIKAIQDKKDAEAKAKAAKAQALANERALIEKAYQEKLAKNPFNPSDRQRYGSRKRRKYRVPYKDYIASVEYEKQKALASINIRESGVQIKNITLSRTAADIQRGKSSGKNVDRHVQYQLAVVRANQDVRIGKISPNEYTQRLSQASQTYQQQAHDFTIRTAQTAAKNLQSERIKQNTARAIASSQGYAVGTIQSSGATSVSKSSSTANVNINNFSTNKPIVTADTPRLQQTREGLVVTVGTEQKTFQSVEAANKYMESKQPKPPAVVQVPLSPYRVTSTDRQTDLANKQQSAYTEELRAGNVGLATALLQPQTKQSYLKDGKPVPKSETSINLETFLTERGFDITKPDTIPNSVFKKERYVEARKQARKTDVPMGDLTKLVPVTEPYKSFKIADATYTDPVLKQRQDARARWEKFAPENQQVSERVGVTSWQVSFGDTTQNFSTEEQAKQFVKGMEKNYEKATTDELGLKIPQSAVVYVDDPVEGRKYFASEKEANEFIEIQEKKKPFTDAKVLPLEQVWQFGQDVLDYNRENAKKNPNSITARVGELSATFGAGMLNAITMGGDAIDRFILKKYDYPSWTKGTTPVEKRQITNLADSTYLKGEEAVFENIKLDQPNWGLTLNNINPLSRENLIYQYGKAAYKQSQKQTFTQNVGDVVFAVPIAALDYITLKGIASPVVKTTEKLLLKGVTKFTGKIAIKDAKSLAVENAPASVWSQSKWIEPKAFDNVVPNPYGKERRIPYAVTQAVGIIKNVKAPKIPYNIQISTIARKTGLGISRGIQYVQDKTPNITIPKLPQSVIDAGIQLQLKSQDLKTQAGIIKRQSALAFRPIDQTIETVGVKFQPTVSKIRDFKYTAQKGIEDTRTFGRELQREARVQYGKAKIPYQIFKRDQGIAFALRKADVVEKARLFKASLDTPNKSIFVNPKSPNIMNRYEKFSTPKFNIPQGIKDVKYKLQLKSQDIKTSIDSFNRADVRLGRELALTGKIFVDKTKTKIKTGLSDTKKGILDVLPEEYRTQTKTIVPYGTKNKWYNITRGEIFPSGKPKDFVLPKPRDKSPLGYSTRKDFSEVSKASAVQKERFGLFASNIKLLGRKGMDEFGKFGDIKNAPRNLYGKYWDQKVSLRNKARAEMKGKPDIFKGDWSLPSYLSSIDPVTKFRSSGVKIQMPLPKGKPSPLNIRKGTLPSDKMSKIAQPIFKKTKNIREDPWTTWAKEQPKFDPKGRNPFWKTKKEPTPIGKDSEEAFQRVARVFRQGGEEPTEKGLGKTWRSPDFKKISGQPKQKISSKEFEGIGNIKTKPINPKQGAPKGYIGKGRLDDIVKSAQATSKPKLGKATNVTRIMKGKDTGLSGLKKSGQKRRKEQKDIDSERKPSTLTGDGTSQVLLPPKPKPEILPKTKKKVSPDSPKPQSIDPKSSSGADTKQESSRNILLPPLLRKKKKKEFVINSITHESDVQYVRESRPKITKSEPKLISQPKVGITAKSIISEKLSTKVTPIQSTRVSVKQIQPQIQPQKQPQKLRERQALKSPSPDPVRPKQRAAPKFRAKAPLRVAIKGAPKVPIRSRAAIIGLPPIIDDPKKKKTKKKESETFGFLGNTKLDNIEGLFKRSTVIYGDKKIKKQIRKDKKAKFKERGVSFFSSK